MSNDKEKIKTLEDQLSQTRSLLSLATDQVIEERRLAEQPKNRVHGGYYMMARSSEKHLRALQKANKTASLVFSVIREHMQIGTNAVTVSNAALAQILAVSTRSVTRATSYLKEKNYVDVIKVGNANTFIVNEQIAFAGNAGQRTAVFSATVIAHEAEQEEGWDTVKKLKAVPVIQADERIFLGNDALEPPDQHDLELN